MKRKYSLIFMTDQGKTSRMRIGSGALRFLIILFIALPLLLCGTLWAGWELLQRYFDLRTENADLRAKLAEQDNIITRLGNLEQFLRAADPDLLRRVLGPAYTSVTSADEPAAGEYTPQANTDSTQLSISSSDASAGAVIGGSAGSGENREHTATETATDISASPLPQTTEAPAASPSSTPIAEGPEEGESVKPNLPPLHETSPEKIDANQPSPPSTALQLDKGMAELKNMKARRVGTRALRISLDLYNTTQGKQLSGKVDFELVLADGREIPLTGGGDTSYRINRLKKIISNPTLPANIENVEGASIRAKVYAGDELIYSGSIPLQ